jgi:hypothetical protein
MTILSFLENDGLVKGIFGQKLDHSAALVQTLDHPFPIHIGNDDVGGLGLERAIHNKRGAIEDTGPHHRIALGNPVPEKGSATAQRVSCHYR